MNALTGTSSLVGLALRRDRFRLAGYVLGLALLQAGMLASTAGQSHQALVEETELFASNPAMRIFGVASGAGAGATTMIRGYLLLAVLAALLSAMLVVRHTRQNEETGRAELVGAAVVGHQAGLAAAVAVAVAANAALVLAIGLAGIAAGQPALGSFTAGLAVGALGMVFAAIAAVTVQLSSTTRGANGLAAAALGACFVVAGVGNLLGSVDDSGLRLESAWPAWLSPVGWGQQMRPFGGDEWAPLALFALGFAALVAAADALAARRDVGSSVFAERRGAGAAAPSLGTSFGLVWRLQRGALLGWAVALVGFGLALGAIAEEVSDMGGATTDWYERMGGSDRIVDAYRASVVAMAGMAVAIYAVQIVLRARAEESDGRLEPILAASVGRPRWLVSYVLNAGVGAILLMLLFGVTFGVTAGAVLGDIPAQIGALVGASLVQLPGIMVFVGVVVVLSSVLPRWASALSWAVILMSVLLGPMFGAATLRLPQWMQDLSPFTHVPRLPGTELATVPLLGLVVLSTLLILVGVAAFRRRDLALPA